MRNFVCAGVSAAILMKRELRLNALAQLVVADLERAARGRERPILQRRNLAIAKCLKFLRSGGVVTVAVDDHELWILTLE